MEKNNIDDAIDNCTQTIETHRTQTRKLLTYIVMVVMLFASIEFFKFAQSYFENRYGEKVHITSPTNIYVTGSVKNDTIFVKNIVDTEYLKLQKDRETSVDKSNSSVSDSGYSGLIIYGMLILVFSVLTSFYRFHQKEISKYEQYLIGFQRIRIAGNNSKEGFDTEVRTSLTKDAFTYENKPIFSKEKKVESPIPGHPTSDLATYIVNKLFDKIEIKK